MTETLRGRLWCSVFVLACQVSMADPPTQSPVEDNPELRKRVLEESRRIVEEMRAMCAEQHKVAFFAMEGDLGTGKCIGPDDPNYQAAQRADEQLEAVMRCNAQGKNAELKGDGYVCVLR